MKKTILSILLLCCMLLTLLPTAAFAADTGKAIQLGTDALSKKCKHSERTDRVFRARP